MAKTVRRARTILGTKRHITCLGLPVKLRVILNGEQTAADLRVFFDSTTSRELQDTHIEKAVQVCQEGGGIILIWKWKK